MPVPIMNVGASLTAVMTVMLPVAVKAPPVPWAPLLPSLKVQSICVLAGGASLLLAYAICCMAELTRALVALLLKVNTSVPSALV